MSCLHGSDLCTCPFAFTEASEQVQNFGCLPTVHEIVSMRVNHGKTWACHDEPTKPCVGAIRFLQEEGLPHKVIDKALVTENDDWSIFCAAIAPPAGEDHANQT